jgi:hypothetical protein
MPACRRYVMTHSKRLVSWLSVPALLSMLAGWPALAADDEDAALDRTPRDCLYVSSVRRTEVLDDQTIIFYMRGNKVAYRNYLPRKCPGLARSGRFMYEIHMSRLCSIDTITVLEQWGVGLQPGFTCKLGDFYPLSPAEVASMKIEKKNGTRPDEAVEVQPVEPADSGSDSGGTPPAAATPEP